VIFESLWSPWCFSNRDPRTHLDLFLILSATEMTECSLQANACAHDYCLHVFVQEVDGSLSDCCLQCDLKPICLCLLRCILAFFDKQCVEALRLCHEVHLMHKSQQVRVCVHCLDALQHQVLYGTTFERNVNSEVDCLFACYLVGLAPNGVRSAGNCMLSPVDRNNIHVLKYIGIEIYM